jgi:hypothetical protein
MMMNLVRKWLQTVVEAVPNHKDILGPAVEQVRFYLTESVHE